MWYVLINLVIDQILQFFLKAWRTPRGSLDTFVEKSLSSRSTLQVVVPSLASKEDFL